MSPSHSLLPRAAVACGWARLSSATPPEWAVQRVLAGGADGQGGGFVWRRRLVVYASKLAACAGMHPYAAQKELLDEFVFAATGAPPDDEPEYLPPAEAARVAIETLTPEARAAFDSAMAALPEAKADASADAVSRAVSAIAAMPDVTPAAAEAVREAMFTTHGCVGEDAIRDKSARDMGVAIRTDARFVTCKRPLFSVGDVDVFVGGKHDGMTEDGRVAEIKNRVRRFLGVPLYERVQLHAYMTIFGVRSGVLIESFKGAERRHDVEFDDELWADVLRESGRFVERCFGGCIRPDP